LSRRHLFPATRGAICTTQENRSPSSNAPATRT
jgi:hypothetical protein